MNENKIPPQLMEVWYADLSLNENSSIQDGHRPVLIVSNNICNEVNNVITVAPMRHQLKRLVLYMHVLIEAPDGGDLLVLIEQIMTIDKKVLNDRPGKIKRRDKWAVEAAIREHLSLTKGDKM